MASNPARRYCALAALIIFAAFSAASGKLIPYILPAFPPLAVLLADGIVSCAWPEEPRALRSPDSRILMESGPLLGLFGAEDQYPSPDQVDDLETLLKNAGKTYEFHRYEGAGHAFFAVDRPSYRPEAATDGWKHVFDHFGRYLASDESEA